MQRLGQWFLAIGILVATGCGTIQSTEPLSDPLAGKLDESLYGHWVTRDVHSKGIKTETHVFVGKHKKTDDPDAIMEIVAVTWDVGGKKALPPTTAYLTVTRIGKHSYINLLGKTTRELSDSVNILSKNWTYGQWKEEEDSTVAIVRYRREGATLRVWLAPDEGPFFDGLVGSGDLKKVDDKIAAESLVKYLKKNSGDELFFESVLFTLVP